MRTWLIAALAVIFCATAAAAQTADLPPSVSRQFDPTWIAQEKKCLAYTVEVEAGGEPFMGKLMVAWVAVKRADDATTPTSIGSVCEAVGKKILKGKKVISEFQAPARGREVVISADSYAAANMVFSGRFVPPQEHMAIRFLYNPEISDPKRAAWFKKLVCPLVINKHVFCRKPTAEDVPLPRPRPQKELLLARR